MLYHYTDRLSGADILKAGVIRARSITLHKDMHGRDHGYETKPLVWLTINPLIETTVIFKMRAAGGWPESPVDNLWRFTVRDDYAPLGLGEYTDANRIDASWWTWTVRSGSLVGSDYTTWRLCPKSIPAADWLAVEVLKNLHAPGVLWEPVPTR